MKTIEINIWILLYVLIQIPGYAQSDKDMINNSMTIPLKIGENLSTHFETLDIEPTNLVVQSKPIHNQSPHIQLELNLVENNKKHTTYLWHYYDSINGPKTNYPKAFNNYVFNLKINKEAEEFELIVEKLNFENPFFIDLGQTAIIENISILFEQSVGEWSEDINGNQTAAFNTYYVSLTEENEQKTILFASLNMSDGKEQSIAWKNYEFLLLEDSEKALKLIVLKKD